MNYFFILINKYLQKISNIKFLIFLINSIIKRNSEIKYNHLILLLYSFKFIITYKSQNKIKNKIDNFK